MAKIEEVEVDVKELVGALNDANIALAALNLKLDEIKTFIGGLGAGSIVTQAQLDALASSIGTAKKMAVDAKTEAEAVLVEADVLDEPTP